MTFDEAMAEWREIHGGEPDPETARHFFSWGAMCARHHIDSVLKREIVAQSVDNSLGLPPESESDRKG